METTGKTEDRNYWRQLIATDPAIGLQWMEPNDDGRGFLEAGKCEREIHATLNIGNVSFVPHLSVTLTTACGWNNRL